MDWKNPSQNARVQVAIAVIRLPARVLVTDPRYGGAIIINPGGPGVSGVDEILSSGRAIQQIVDSDLEPPSPESSFSPASNKYFDIISFDPRGINNTTPHLRRYPNAAAQMRWANQLAVQEVIDDSETAFEIAWARAKALGQSCLHSDTSPTSDLSKFTNTAPVVADIVEIIEQHGNWRGQKTQNWLRESFQKGLGIGDRRSIISRTKWRRGKEKLQYLGFSYGTFLGATFAAMHPDRVQRMILDGVLDIGDYYRGEWLMNLQDTDGIVEKFFEYCHRAGPNGCSVFAASPQQIKENLEKLLQSLQEQAISVPGIQTRGPDIITSSDIMRMIKTTLYNPLKRFTVMADLLTDLTKGNGSAFADYKIKSAAPPCRCEARDHDIYDCNPGDFSWEAFASIACTDGDNISNMTSKSFKEYAEVLRTQSRWMGSTWAELRLNCVGWDSTAAWKFNGHVAAETSHPLLIIGNSLDPISPIRKQVVKPHGK